MLLFVVVFSLIVSLFSNSTFADVKVAFVADQSTSENAQAVLRLIKQENADLLLLQGDLGYFPEMAKTWDAILRQFLGTNFPVLAVVGNHENFEWPLYKKYIKERIDRVDELSCEGDIGVKALCTFRDLAIVQVAPAITEVEGVLPKDNYDRFITQQFSNSSAQWRICSWHKNQQLMQIGGKTDETGWAVYQACRRAGAIVATGHEHSYSRTHLLSDFTKQTVVHSNNHLELAYGHSFAFVSGLGGLDIREQFLTGDWWAAEYSSTQNASYGALFCNFGDTQAECYFKDIKGVIADRFTLATKVGSAAPVTSSDNTAAGVWGFLLLLFEWAGLVLMRSYVKL